MQTPTLGLVATIGVLVLVAAAYYTGYPAIRLTIWKANPSHVHVAARCGC